MIIDDNSFAEPEAALRAPADPVDMKRLAEEEASSRPTPTATK